MLVCMQCPIYLNSLDLYDTYLFDCCDWWFSFPWQKQFHSISSELPHDWSLCPWQTSWPSPVEWKTMYHKAVIKGNKRTVLPTATDPQSKIEINEITVEEAPKFVHIGYFFKNNIVEKVNKYCALKENSNRPTKLLRNSIWGQHNHFLA